MADRTTAALFADFFIYLAGIRDPKNPVKPTQREIEFAHELWKKIGDYDFSPYQMSCDRALRKLKLAHVDPRDKSNLLYGPKGTE